MRKKLVGIWNSIMRIKLFYPLVVVGRKLIFLDSINTIVDLLDRHTNKEQIKSVCEFFKLNSGRIQENIDCFEDDRSRDVYRDILMYRCTLNRNYLRKARDPLKLQYFAPDIIKLKNNEFFIDCGSYTGDTIISLYKINNYVKEYKLTALCLEPDKYNALNCKNNLNKIARKYSGFKGYVIQKGVWKEIGTLYFKEGEEYSNKLEEEKKECFTEVEVTSIDCAVKRYREKTGNNEKVTFIKMDIEGSEPEALIGGMKTILKDRPILAIAIYHTEEQMISIIEYCRNNLPNYKYYVRHYSPAWGETDLYAIPCERD